VALQALHLRRSEAWIELFGTVVMAERTPAKFSFHRPVFHDAVNQSWFDDLDLKQLQKRDEKRQLKRNGELQTSGKGEAKTCKSDLDNPDVEAQCPDLEASIIASTSEASRWCGAWDPLLPRVVLQCHLPQAERLAAYLDGRILSPCTRDRLIMLYHGKWDHDLEMQLQEGHLQSIVQRIYYVDTRQKATSLRDASRGYLTQLLGPCPSVDSQFVEPSKSSLWEFLRRARNFMSFPRELEDRLKAIIDASPWSLAFCKRPTGSGYAGTPEGDVYDALILPKDRCDTMIYADGLFWWMVDSPRTIIPARDNRTVPSAAYWKLLEIFDRYNPSAAVKNESVQTGNSKKALEELYTGRYMAMDIGASPGGWSYCLATKLQTQRVIACDPAAYMHPVVRNLVAEDVRDEFVKDFTQEEQKEDAKNLTHMDMAYDSWKNEAKTCGQICHWRMRGDEGLRKLQAEAMKLSLFVCDMNDALESSCNLLYQVFKEKLYEPPCLAVVTFKNTCKSKAEFQERKRAMIAKLTEDGILMHLQEIHLFANTRLSHCKDLEW